MLHKYCFQLFSFAKLVWLLDDEYWCCFWSNFLTFTTFFVVCFLAKVSLDKHFREVKTLKNEVKTLKKNLHWIIFVFIFFVPSFFCTNIGQRFVSSDNRLIWNDFLSCFFANLPLYQQRRRLGTVATCVYALTNITISKNAR